MFCCVSRSGLSNRASASYCHKLMHHPVDDKPDQLAVIGCYRFFFTYQSIAVPFTQQDFNQCPIERTRPQCPLGAVALLLS